MRRTDRPQARALAGILGGISVVGGLWAAMHYAFLGAILITAGNLLVLISAGDLRKHLRVRFLGMRIGSWIAILVIVGGGVLSLKDVARGSFLGLFGLYVECFIGKSEKGEASS